MKLEIPCRDVMRSVPLPYWQAKASKLRYCELLMTPPGTRVRTMKMYCFAILRLSRSSCW